MKHYVGIDLHARTLQLCVIDAEKTARQRVNTPVARYGPDSGVGKENSVS